MDFIVILMPKSRNLIPNYLLSKTTLSHATRLIVNLLKPIQNYMALKLVFSNFHCQPNYSRDRLTTIHCYRSS